MKPFNINKSFFYLIEEMSDEDLSFFIHSPSSSYQPDNIEEYLNNEDLNENEEDNKTNRIMNK